MSDWFENQVGEYWDAEYRRQFQWQQERSRESAVKSDPAEIREMVSRLRRPSAVTAPPLGEDDMAGLANTWVVGADPEFVMLSGKKALNMKAFLPEKGEVGYDHSGHVAEIRPKPCKGTYALLKSMQKHILTNAKLNAITGAKWRAGAAFKAKVEGIDGRRDGLADAAGERLLTLGGHVHFDFPPPAAGQEDEQHDLFIKAQDRLTALLEELDILPKAESTVRRQGNRQGYGRFGDWRAAGDDNKHVEYRTMASWLYHPVAAYLALTASKLAAVSPQLAIDIIKPNSASYVQLKALFEAYRHKDMNARRGLEKLLDEHTVKFVQHDPDVNFREKWERLGV